MGLAQKKGWLALPSGEFPCDPLSCAPQTIPGFTSPDRHHVCSLNSEGGEEAGLPQPTKTWVTRRMWPYGGKHTHAHTLAHIDTHNSRSKGRIQPKKCVYARNALLTCKKNFTVHLLHQAFPRIRMSLFNPRANPRRQELVSPSHRRGSSL